MDAYIPPEVRRSARRQRNEDARQERAPYPLRAWTELPNEEKLRYLCSSGLMSHSEEQRLREEDARAKREYRAAGIAFAIIIAAGFIAVALWG